MAESTRAAQEQSSQGLKGAKQVGGDFEGPLILPALRMCHDANIREQGRQALSLLRLLQRFEARLGSLSFSVRPGRWDGGDHRRTDLEGESGLWAPKENSGGCIQAKKKAPGGSGIGTARLGTGAENLDRKHPHKEQWQGQPLGAGEC